MQAVLNRLTGTALLVEGERISLLHMDGDMTAPASAGELARVIGEGRNIDVVSVTGVDDAREQLRRAYLCEESLDLALILLDSDLSETTRKEAALNLNSSLLDWQVRSWLEGVLYGAPLPSEADIEGAHSMADHEECRAVSALLSQLSHLQDVIQRAHVAWTSVCVRVLPPSARQEATVLAGRRGVFRHLVHALEGSEPGQFRFAALQALQPLHDHRRLVEELTLELQLIRRHRRPIEPLPVEEDAPPIKPNENPKDSQSFSFDRTAVFENIKRQKEAIVRQMRLGRLDLVHRYVAELVDYQLPLDHRGEKTSMSLCDLAMEAKALDLFEFQLELATRAVSVRYQDGWAWAQVADALSMLNRFD